MLNYFQAIAQAVGIPPHRILARAKPDDKKSYIEYLQATHRYMHILFYLYLSRVYNCLMRRPLPLIKYQVLECTSVHFILFYHVNILHFLYSLQRRFLSKEAECGFCG